MSALFNRGKMEIRALILSSFLLRTWSTPLGMVVLSLHTEEDQMIADPPASKKPLSNEKATFEGCYQYLRPL